MSPSPIAPRVETRLHGLTEDQHVAREREYLSQVADALREGERPIEVVLGTEGACGPFRDETPALYFPAFDGLDGAFRVSANTEGVTEEDAAYREVNIVPAAADEFPRLPFGFDDGDVEVAADLIRTYIRRRIVEGRATSGLAD